METILTPKQKEVIKLLREGYFLYENVVTPAARWSLTKNKDSFRWGSVNGNVIAKITHLLISKKINFAVKMYELNQQGKIIKL